MEYCSNFKYDLEVGQVKEIELAKILSNKKIEVKTDLKAADTGNVYVEYESRNKASGIAKTESDYYCFVISDYSFFFIKTSELKVKCRKYLNTNRDKRGGDNNTSKGILLPIIELIK
jgi:hypothetical protein